MRTLSLNKSLRPRASQSRARNGEAGFSIVELVLALVILTIGLLGMASAIGYGLMATNRGRNITNTKLLVISILEQMETLRNTRELTFGQISNVGQVNNTGAARNFAGFPNTFQPISINPGPDGVFGTADDLLDPGPDQTYGTGDDFVNQTLARPNYGRRILITTLSSDLKRVEVTLTFPGGAGETRTMTAISYLNNDARSNFRP